MSYIGTTKIGKMFLGNTEIAKAYLGSDLVFQKGGSPTPVQVDYIETDGVAYIDTLIAGDTPLSFELNVVPVIPASGNNYIMGARKDSGDTRVIPLLVNTNGYAGYAYAGQIYNGTNTGINCEASAQNQTMMLVRCSFSSKNQYFGTKQAGESSYTTKHTTVTGTISSNYSIVVFGNHNLGNIVHCLSGVRIEHVKIWSGIEYTGLIFDGTACLYNGEYGLWDNVSNTFFGNAADSGAFSGPSNL